MVAPPRSPPKVRQHRRRPDVDHRLPVLRHESITNDAIAFSIFSATPEINLPCRYRSGDYHHVLQLLPFQFVDDVEDVGVEIDPGRQKMRAFPNSLSVGAKTLS